MLEILQKLVGEKQVWEQEPMSDHTTFRVGGCARYLVEPKDKKQLAEVITACQRVCPIISSETAAISW